MVECAELARAGRRPTAFHGCAHGAGGGPAMGVLQPPLPLAQKPAITAFAGPVIVYDRDAAPDLSAPFAQPNREPRPQATPRHQAVMRRVA